MKGPSGRSAVSASATEATSWPKDGCSGYHITSQAVAWRRGGRAKGTCHVSFKESSRSCHMCNTLTRVGQKSVTRSPLTSGQATASRQGME